MLQSARHMLNMPDLFHYFFTGKAVNESTIASTTQMCDLHTHDWNKTLLTRLGIPSHFLSDQIDPGTIIGKIRNVVAEAADITSIDVTLPGGHDTASAVAAVPVDSAASENWAYLSSGTWSLLGAELEAPIVTDDACETGFTNERGVCNTVRLLKNIAGLWLLQQVRRDLASRGEAHDYGELVQLGEKATPFRTLLNPDYGPFASPGDMCRKIDAFADVTGQPRPDSAGAYTRAVLESLAFAYRQALKTLERLLGRSIDTLYLVGGGGKNRLLNQMTADAVGCKVIVGPYEATAIGNALTQAMGQGQIENLSHLRQVVRNSFELSTWHPKCPEDFDRENDRYQTLCDVEQH